MAFDINQHLQGMGFGRGEVGGKPKEDPANSKDLPAVIDPKKGLHTLGKMAGLPVNIGAVFDHGGMQQGFERDAVTDQKMMQSSLLTGSSGGFLAKLLHDIFVKNSAITDHTGGVGGSASGEGGGSGGGGGGGGGDSAVASGGGSSFADFNSMGVGAGSHGNFSFIDIPMASLGTFSPPAMSSGASTGAGMDIG